MQKFDRWQEVEVLHGGRWMPARYTRPMSPDESILTPTLIAAGLTHNAIPDHGDGEGVDEFAYKDAEIRLPEGTDAEV